MPDIHLSASLVLTTFQHTVAIYTGVSHECEAFTKVPDIHLSASLVLTTSQLTDAIYIGADIILLHVIYKAVKCKKAMQPFENVGSSVYEA